jgi:hypothetical protein
VLTINCGDSALPSSPAYIPGTVQAGAADCAPGVPFSGTPVWIPYPSFEVQYAEAWVVEGVRRDTELRPGRAPG